MVLRNVARYLKKEYLLNNKFLFWDNTCSFGKILVNSKTGNRKNNNKMFLSVCHHLVFGISKYLQICKKKFM